jgi:hypothetical protein
MKHEDSYIVVKEFTANGKKTREVVATGVTKQGFIDAYTEKGCVMRGGENPRFEDIYSGVVFKIERGGLNSFADGGAIRGDFSESRTTDIYESQYFQTTQVSDRVSVEYSGRYDVAYISSEINHKDENLSDETFYITALGVSKLHSILGKLVELLIDTKEKDFSETRKTDKIESKGLGEIVTNEIIVEYFAETETINIESLVRYEDDYLIKSGSAYFSIGGVFKLYSILENLMNFFVYGRKMNDGGEVNEIRKMDIQIAKTILMQLGGTARLQMFTGAYNFVALPHGVSFRIKNRRVNYVKIVLNLMDTYDVEFGLIRGANYKVVKELNGIYNDQLVDVFTRYTGMVLRLRDGGAIQGEENSEMAMNQNLQIRHHTEELEEILKSGKEVPAWVVSKLSRAADSISDATHYLEGTPDKMAMGGGVGKVTEVNGKYRNNNTDDPYTFSSNSKGLDFLTNHKNIEVLSIGQGKYDLFYGWDNNKQKDGTLYFGKWNSGNFGFRYDGTIKYAKGGGVEKKYARGGGVHKSANEIKKEIEALKSILEVLEGADKKSIEREIERLKLILSYGGGEREVVDISKLKRFSIQYIPNYNINSVMKFQSKVVVAESEEDAISQLPKNSKVIEIVVLRNRMAMGGGVHENTITDLNDFDPNTTEIIDGDACFFDYPHITNLGVLREIKGTADFTNSKVRDLGNLETILGGANFGESRIENLGKLKTIKGFANFSESRVQELGNLHTIGKGADFSHSIVQNLGNLTKIGGDAYFYDSKIKALGSLKVIEGKADFHDSKIEDLGDLQRIEGIADFRNTSIKSLGNLIEIDGNAYFENSKIQNLGKLKNITGKIFWGNRTDLKNDWERGQSRR